ncbi:unnamed protein product [Durusdinium trenchii]|uniref:Uncharacterized protein n=1 Tax=Durusdinium trenchii TaxID=1381693 RepID=A0ABP0LZ82_9DINO
MSRVYLFAFRRLCFVSCAVYHLVCCMCVLELGSHDIVSFSILFLLAANVEGSGTFCAQTLRSCSWILRHPRGQSPQSACLTGAWQTPRHARAEVEDLEDVEEIEDDDDEVDLDADPNWPKVKQDMVKIWNIRYESEDWLLADDVKGLMDEHLQSVVGKANYLDMEETFVEVAEDEPRPGEISREDFSEIAGIYVYNALYTS